MKVLFLTAYYFPEHVASSYLGNNIRESLCREGIDVEIYTPTPCRGLTADQQKKYCSYEYKKESVCDGKMIINRFSLYAEGNDPILRGLRYLLCFIKHFNRGLSANNIDVIFLASTPPIQGLLGGILRKLKKVPFVYNLQDIFPDSLSGTGLAKKNGFLWKLGRVIENFTYKNADKIIVISEDFKKNIMAKGVPEEKIVVAYNWVDENAVVPVEDVENPLFDEFGISCDKFRLVYAGNLGNAQNINIIIDAAAKMKDNDNVEFFVFGKGGLESEIRARIEFEKLTNIKLLPLQPFERVSYVYSLGDVCIVACKPGLGGAAMPSKTWSIMSSGSAVLANFDEGELKTIIESNNCGVFTKAGDLDGFVAAIEELSQNPAKCKEMGRNGREFIMNNLTKKIGTQKYVDVIKSYEKK